MKILQVLPRMDVGGVERGVLDLAGYFKDKEDEIIVVSGGGRLVEDLEALGVKHYKLDVYSKSFFNLLRIKALRKIIKKESVDIVHARSRVPGWISFFATRNSETDFITTAHGSYSVHFLSEVMGWGKFVICPSKVIARHMQDNFGVKPDKISIISRWVNFDKFEFKPYKERISKVSILSIGRISPSKGYEYLIEAMRRVLRSNPYVNLLIIGSAEGAKSKYLRHLKTLVYSYSLNYNIKFLGYQKDIGRFLKSAAMLVVPSVVEESFGRVIVEAFACGTPVIATRVGAFNELVENRKDGILVTARDSAALSSAVLELLDNPNLAEQIAQAAFKKVKAEYSLPACVSRIAGLYRQIRRLKRVMVIKISSLGDIILALPSFKAIREHFPESHITVLTLKKYISLFDDCPYVDETIGLDSDYKKVNNILKISAKLRRGGYDYVVDLQNNYASHLLSFLTFPRKSFGYLRKLGFLLTDRIAAPKLKLDPLDSQKKILNILGVDFKDKSLLLWPSKGFSLERLGLSESVDYVGINVSASRKWSTKNWPVRHTKKLIELISKEFPVIKIVLVGDKDGISIAKQLEAPFKKEIINLCGKTTLKDLMGMFGCLKLFISQDTATLHLSSAAGIETIGLFGPTDPQKHTISSDNLHIISKKLDCSFCYKSKCVSGSCMEKISPGEVFTKVKNILAKPTNKK